MADERPIDGLKAALRAGDLDFGAPPEKARADFEATLALIPVADDVAFEKGELGGVPALAIVPPGAGDTTLLYLHGGAFIAGSAWGYRALAAELCRAAGAKGWSLDYRLAPEHLFPAAIDDCASAYAALLEAGTPASQIVIAGDSAGGGLVAALMLRLRDEGLPQPRAALAISPWADMACTADSYASKAEADPSLSPAGLRTAAKLYLGQTPASDPLASPVQARCNGLAPTLIQVGSDEVLLDDAVALARALGHGGSEVHLEIAPEMVHVWHAFAFMLPEGAQALAAAGAFLAKPRQRSE